MSALRAALVAYVEAIEDDDLVAAAYGMIGDCQCCDAGLQSHEDGFDLICAECAKGRRHAEPLPLHPQIQAVALALSAAERL